jgi:hypothetical protein
MEKRLSEDENLKFRIFSSNFDRFEAFFFSFNCLFNHFQLYSL